MSLNINGGGGIGSLFSKVGEMVNKAVDAAKEAAAKATQVAPPPEKPDNSNAQYFQGNSTYEQPEQPKFNDLVYHPGQDQVHIEKIGTKNSTSGGGDSGSTMI